MRVDDCGYGNMGVDVDLDRVYTAAAAAADYVVEPLSPAGRQQAPRIYNLATEGIQDMLDGLVDWVQTEAEPCDAVVIGAPCQFACHAGTPAGGPASAAKGRGRGRNLLRSRLSQRSRPGIRQRGALLATLLRRRRRTDLLRKTPGNFFEELCRRLKVQPDWCLLIGDNLESDIFGAKAVGMRTILTLTGVTRRGDLAKLPAEWQPDLVIEDLTELL